MPVKMPRTSWRSRILTVLEDAYPAGLCRRQIDIRIGATDAVNDYTSGQYRTINTTLYHLRQARQVSLSRSRYARYYEGELS